MALVAALIFLISRGWCSYKHARRGTANFIVQLGLVGCCKHIVHCVCYHSIEYTKASFTIEIHKRIKTLSRSLTQKINMVGLITHTQISYTTQRDLQFQPAAQWQLLHERLPWRYLDDSQQRLIQASQGQGRPRQTQQWKFITIFLKISL